MKKFIIAAAVLMSSSSALAAEAPKVEISGRLDTIVAHVKQSDVYRTTNPSQPTARLHDRVIINNTLIDINVDGKTDSNLKYGGLIRFHADTSKAINSETSVGDKTMFYLQSDKFGRFEAGNTPGAGGLFEMELLFLNRGTYGVDGYWSQLVTDKTVRTTSIADKPVLAGSTALTNAIRTFDARGLEFIVSPNILSNYSGNHYSDAPKISFFTKPVKQLTVGVSFIPDMDSTGSIAGVATKTGGPVFDSQRANNPATFRNIVSGGGTLDVNPADKINFKTSFVGEVGKAKNPLIRDLRALEAGMLLCYDKTFKFGGTVGTWGKSLTLKNPVANAKQKSLYWTLGTGYEHGKLGTSLTFMKSYKAGGIEALTTNPSIAQAISLTSGLGANGLRANDFSDFATNKFSNVVLDIEYNLAPGFQPFAGVSRFEFKESAGSKDKGVVIMGGTRLLF